MIQSQWKNNVESFPLSVREVFRPYTKLPSDVSNSLFHYTTHCGIEGILRNGGLRATNRKKMNDAGEFEYARKVVYELMNEISSRNDLAQSLTTYTRKNFDQFLKGTDELSSDYCACLTFSSDHQGISNNSWGVGHFKQIFL